MNYAKMIHDIGQLYALAFKDLSSIEPTPLPPPRFGSRQWLLATLYNIRKRGLHN